VSEHHADVVVVGAGSAGAVVNPFPELRRRLKSRVFCARLPFIGREQAPTGFALLAFNIAVLALCAFPGASR